MFPVLTNRMVPKVPCLALYHIQQDVSKTENYISVTLCGVTVCWFQ